MELVVGRVAKSHGVRGELAVDVRTDAPEIRFAEGAILQGRKPREKKLHSYTVEAVREHSGRLLLRLVGVDGREAADALRGTLFVIDSADVEPSEDPDEYYDHELEGLDVRLPDGTIFGKVREVLHTLGGELLAVRPAGEGPEILVPFVNAIVTTISTADGVIDIDPPVGLLNLADAETDTPPQA
ncbi:ribosome maturation factor RimM [Tomitella biformata]|uniref:ribosome maturation factor RimM n=1 Tax=Tomitella biformata TaxID=630403 RepID=UPI000462F6CA|nr:ribosome maturation factor RimM [Tomitella biformata]